MIFVAGYLGLERYLVAKRFTVMLPLSPQNSLHSPMSAVQGLPRNRVRVNLWLHDPSPSSGDTTRVSLKSEN